MIDADIILSKTGIDVTQVQQGSRRVVALAPWHHNRLRGFLRDFQPTFRQQMDGYEAVLLQ